MEKEERHKIPVEGLQVPKGFELYNDGLFSGSDEDLRLVSAFPFYVDARVRHRERGAYYYRVVVQDDCEDVTLYIPADKGPKGVVRAVVRTGAYIRCGLAIDYVDEFLALNFKNLPVVEFDDCQDEMLELEAGSVYELLLEYLTEHEEEFAEKKLGKYLEDGSTVAVKQFVMHSFFKQFSISNVQSVFRYWMQKEILLAGGDGKHYSRVLRVDGVPQRVYVIKVLREKGLEESSQGQGIQPGDTVSLAVGGTNEKMILTLTDEYGVGRFASGLSPEKTISTKSKLGASLIGKIVGDAVKIKSDSSVTVYGILKVHHGLVRRFKYVSDPATRAKTGMNKKFEVL